jgi:nucleotide-binding universal stress UspA family protein
MSTPVHERVVIVGAVDPTAASEHVIYTATGLAASLVGAELHFIQVVDIPTAVHGAYVSPVADLLREARVFVDGTTRAAATVFGGRTTGHVAVGAPAAEILQLAADVEADLIVVGTHGKEALARLVVGSVSRAVMSGAQCAVLIARPKSYEPAPEIQPPCPDCRAVQRETGGDTLWCSRHAERHVRGHVHYQAPEGFGVGSMLIRP